LIGGEKSILWLMMEWGGKVLGWGNKIIREWESDYGGTGLQNNCSCMKYWLKSQPPLRFRLISI